jgi:pyrimidine-nucleoside phosphorylase
MGRGVPVKQAVEIAESNLEDGSALGKLRDMIIEQGGDPEVLNDFSLFKQPARTIEIRAESSGYVKRMDAGKIGLVSMKLGAGRIKKGDSVDFSAGIKLTVKPGDKVEQGNVIAYLYTDRKETEEPECEFEKALEYSETKPAVPGVISGRVTKDGKEKY